MRYVAARAVDYSERKAFMRYASDAIMLLTKNTATSERSYITMRFSDILEGKKPPKQESADEIVSRIRAGVEGNAE